MQTGDRQGRARAARWEIAPDSQRKKIARADSREGGCKK